MGEEQPEQLKEIAVDLIEEPDVLLHPVTSLDELEELANSIKHQGLIEPIIVRQVGDKYKLVVGYRRYLACKKFGIPRILARILPLSERDSLLSTAVENIQRSDIDPVAEGQLYHKLIFEQSYPIGDIAKKLGKSEGYIESRLALLDMPGDIQEMVRRKELKLGIVPHLRRIREESDKILVASDLAKRGFTVDSAKRIIDAFLKYREEMKEAPREEVLEKAEEEPLATCEWCRGDKKLRFFRSLAVCDECYRELIFLQEKYRREQSESLSIPPE